jgi:hypothetical protein
LVWQCTDYLVCTYSQVRIVKHRWGSRRSTMALQKRFGIAGDDPRRER